MPPPIRGGGIITVGFGLRLEASGTDTRSDTDIDTEPYNNLVFFGSRLKYETETTVTFY